MKPFAELTWSGKLRRYRHLAKVALAEYDLTVTRITLIGDDTNIIYRGPRGRWCTVRAAHSQWPLGAQKAMPNPRSCG